MRTLRLLPLCALLFVTACGSPKQAAIVDLGSGREIPLFTLGSLRGARDGDRLQAQAMFSDSSSILTLEMRFAVGAPTRLESGTWAWSRNNRVSSGTLSARAVTFLGGQSGPPSIGGAFDLLDASGTARYRARLPVTEIAPLPRGAAATVFAPRERRKIPAAVR